jgi:IS5 family transposase
MQSRYRHANQHKRANREVRKLKTYLGRVVRDIRRKAGLIDPELSKLLLKADRLLAQEHHSKNKLYSIHAEEVECISKGKAHKRYEFGNKVGFVSTSRKNWIIGIKSFHGNPYDGHTLKSSLQQAEEMSNVPIMHAHVDKGYRGHNYTGQAQVHIAGRKRKKSRWERMWRRRRAAVEPVISHAKHDNRMIRNHLKGIEGDQINAILSACGYNLRKLIRASFWSDFLNAFLDSYWSFSALIKISKTANSFLIYSVS